MRYLPLIATLIVALVVVGCSKSSATPPAMNVSLPTVHCTQHPVPEFSLGSDSSPGELEQSALCDCIWSRLDAKDRKVAARLAERKPMPVNSTFPLHFGKVLQACSVSRR